MENQNEENKIKTNSVKRKIIIAALVLAGVLIGYEIGIRAYFYYIRPYFSGMAYRNYVDAYIQLQLNDFTGGDTPEETVDLFIEALKEGDYELASKYFVIDKQENVKKVLKEKDIFEIIKEIEYAKENWKKENKPTEGVNFWYNTTKENVAMTNEINLAKNVNNKWKIKSMYIYYLAE